MAGLWSIDVPGIRQAVFHAAGRMTGTSTPPGTSGGRAFSNWRRKGWPSLPVKACAGRTCCPLQPEKRDPPSSGRGAVTNNGLARQALVQARFTLPWPCRPWMPVVSRNHTFSSRCSRSQALITLRKVSYSWCLMLAYSRTKRSPRISLRGPQSSSSSTASLRVWGSWLSAP